MSKKIESPSNGLQRRTLLQGTAGILAAGVFPAIHAQEKIVLRYLGTAVNQDKAIAEKFKADTGIEIQYVAVTTDDVTKRFGETVAVKELSLTIPHGSYCCLLGPSGCGKTTILRMIAGHENPTTGDVRIGGKSVVGLPQVERGTAMMFQSYALFPHR
ncbi:MAG: ATP-binding cassette domain-containing protein, partial [Variovorax sp.]